LLAALVLAWCGGYFLAGRALSPVDRITRAAEREGMSINKWAEEQLERAAG